MQWNSTKAKPDKEAEQPLSMVNLPFLIMSTIRVGKSFCSLRATFHSGQPSGGPTCQWWTGQKAKAGKTMDLPLYNVLNFYMCTATTLSNLHPGKQKALSKYQGCKVGRVRGGAWESSEGHTVKHRGPHSDPRPVVPHPWSTTMQHVVSNYCTAPLRD